MKKEIRVGFGDLAAERRRVKSKFLDQVNSLIDWRPISNIIHKYYTKGWSKNGPPAYDGLLLFKMSLLQTWYGLRDYEIEEQVNDRITFSRFVGLSMDSKSPDHSVISRFRSHMTEKKAYEKLFKVLNKQLEKHHIIVKTGAIVDASITSSPLTPSFPKAYEIVSDRLEESFEEDSKTQGHAETSVHFAEKKSGIDAEARWLKKGNKLYYGYKQHVITERQGMILGLVTTGANEQDTSQLEALLKTTDLPPNIPLFADKGYRSKKNGNILYQSRLRDCIERKATRSKSLSFWEKKFNKIIGKTRYKIERVFGSIKRWFSATQARYRGVEKMHTQHLLQAMAYNLYRAPGILMSNRQQ